MTDPKYGDSPLDADALYYQGQRPVLVRAVAIEQLGVVWRMALVRVIESQWLTRWRRALAEAEGAQLEARAAEVRFLCPAGWSEDRCRAVLIAVVGASVSTRTVARAYALAQAVLDVGQSVTLSEEFPCSARFVFLETSADDAVSYATVLDRARPNGCQFFVVAHPGGGADPFTIGTSEIGGPDTLAEAI